MATTTVTEAAPAPITSKRKRNQVSYIVDSYFDDLDLDDEDVELEEEDEDDTAQSEDDDTYDTVKVCNS